MIPASDKLQTRALTALYKAHFTGKEVRALLLMSRKKEEELLETGK